MRAPNPGPYTLRGTNCWVLGRNPAYVIDPGPAIGAHLDALAGEVEARGGAAAILLTHDHDDHGEGAAALASRTGAPLAAANRPDAAIALADGVNVGPLRALATPGHADDHYAFVAGGVCFCGDLVLGVGSVFIPPQPGALAAYMASLERLRTLELDLLAPGHGPLITDPGTKLEEYVSHRLDRERRLVEALADGLRAREDLLDRVWPEVPPELRQAAAATLAAHLDKLAGEGRLPAA